MTRFPALAAAVILLSAVASPLLGATYYVAPPPAGDDANPGTEALPWATLQHAADTVQPGDTVLVRTGAYAGAHFTTSGTATEPIVFRAYPGEEPEVVADNGVTPDGLNLEGASHMVVEGFRVDGRTRAGIRAVLCEHVTLRGNRADGNGRWGIFTGFCDDLLIEGNVTTGSLDEHGIYVSNSGDRPVIRNNLISGNFANGIHMNGDVSQGGDGVISDAVVENNVIGSNGAGGGSGINMDGVQDSIIRNNLIYDSHASGISLYRIDGGAPSTGNRVLNNTVLVAADGRWALNVQDASSGNFARNNVLLSDHSFRGSISISVDSLPGFDSDRNVLEDAFTTDGGNTVIDFADWQAMGYDASSQLATQEELFEDPAAGDYRLKVGSPAVDAGETLADVPADLEAAARPIGAAYDVGAFEGAGKVFGDGFESGDVRRWSSTSP